jgi:hypothetical protein
MQNVLVAVTVNEAGLSMRPQGLKDGHWNERYISPLRKEHIYSFVRVYCDG